VAVFRLENVVKSDNEFSTGYVGNGPSRKNLNHQHLHLIFLNLCACISVYGICCQKNGHAVCEWDVHIFGFLLFFLIGIVRGGVQLGSLFTAATNRPIVPSPGNYDDGEIDGIKIGKGNRSIPGKPAPVPLYPLQTPHAARTRTQAAAV
jgi:hypothetical protein